MAKERRRWGDRKDGKLIRDLDGMHFITPLLYPNRCDNEAYISERIDLTEIDRYLAEKNADNPEFKYTLFHLIVTAVIKCITLRPKLNRFIANKNFYQRNEISASFVIKKQFQDESREGLAFVHAKEDSTLETIRADIYRQVTDCRSGKIDASSDSMDLFNKMPRFLSKFIVWVITRLDKHGKVPSSLIATDPYYSSVILSNLGSIGMKCGYHHLTNWGTNSLFVIVGEIGKRKFYDKEGNETLKNSVELGLTIDERLADGYYYSKTVKLLKYLLEHPQLLEHPVNEEIPEELYKKR